MKKYFSLFLAMVIAFSALPAFGADSDSENMQKVLLSVKERIPLTDDYPEFSGNVREQNGDTVYRFEWRSSPDADIYRYMSVTATEDGLITAFSENDDDFTNQLTPSVNGKTRIELLDAAKKLSSKLNPGFEDTLIVYDSSAFEDLYASSVSFELQRVENGIPVFGNTGSITIDSDGEKIESYYINYTDNVTFPDISNVISKDEAQKAFTDKLGMKLEYYSSYNKGEKLIYPAYTEVDSSKYINALTGEVFSPVRDEYAFREEATNDKAMLNSGGGSGAQLSEAEIKELDNISGLLSKDEIIKLIKENKLIAPDSDTELFTYSVNRAYDNKNAYYANISFRSTGNNTYKHSNYTLNAATGELNSFYRYDDNSAEGKKEISEEKAAAILKSAAKALAGKKIDEYRTSENTSAYTESYIRFVNGIPFREDSIYIELNKYTGEIIIFRAGYTEAEFPSVTSAITKEEASARLFDAIEYKLSYFVDKNGATPVYIPETDISRRIDPFTGRLLSYNHEEYKENKPSEYSDINGHYAEETIKKLAKYGIGFDSDEFRPDSPITQQDFIALLSSTFINRMPIILGAKTISEDYYRIAKRHNIILDEEIDKDAPVSRELSAKFIINALGIGEYAKLDEIFNCPFTDVCEYKGHISLLYGLGVIKGDGSGKFNPKHKLSRADAAIMLYNYLTR